MKARNTRLLVALMLGASASAQAQPSPTAQEVIRGLDDKDELVSSINKLMLHGYSQGFLWMSEAYKLNGARPVYCVPLKLTVTAEQSVRILRDYLDDNPSQADKPVGAVLLFAYTAAFPCQ